MYVVVQDNKIIKAFDGNTHTLSEIESQYPGLEIKKSSLVVPPDEAPTLLRLFKKRVVSKVSAVIDIDKNEVFADGNSEVLVTVTLFGLQPEERIKTVVVDIDGAEIITDIDQNNKGQLIFATKIKGLHIITVEDDNVHCCPKAVIAK